MAGVLLVLLSATVYAVAMVAQKVVLRRIPGLQVTWLACAIGAVACLPFAGSLAGRPAAGESGADPRRGLPGPGAHRAGLLDLGVRAEPQYAGKLGVTTFAVPPIAIGLGWLFLNEVPALLAVVGGVLSLVGVAIARRTPRVRPLPPPACARLAARRQLAGPARQLAGDQVGHGHPVQEVVDLHVQREPEPLERRVGATSRYRDPAVLAVVDGLHHLRRAQYSVLASDPHDTSGCSSGTALGATADVVGICDAPGTGLSHTRSPVASRLAAASARVWVTCDRGGLPSRPPAAMSSRTSKPTRLSSAIRPAYASGNGSVRPPGRAAGPAAGPTW